MEFFKFTNPFFCRVVSHVAPVSEIMILVSNRNSVLSGNTLFGIFCEHEFRMFLPCLIICSHICRFRSYFPVAVPDVQVLREIPALLLFMASLAAVVVRPIELY